MCNLQKIYPLEVTINEFLQVGGDNVVNNLCNYDVNDIYIF